MNTEQLHTGEKLLYYIMERNFFELVNGWLQLTLAIEV